jgi:hypothetical protein
MESPKKALRCFSTVVFYGLRIFGCKTAQFHEMQRESDLFRLPMKNKLCNAAKTYATR